MEILLTQSVIFYPSEQKVVVNGNDIQLTKKESGLLDILYKNKNLTVYRSEVLTELWGEDNYFNGRSMDVYICRLRKIFKSLESVEIVSVHGIGHKLMITPKNGNHGTK